MRAPVIDVTHPRCPFAGPGRFARESMAACPGFLPETLLGGGVRGNGDQPSVPTCGHLAGARVASGRFVPACHHPEADWVVGTAHGVLRAV